ncbi:hypothetical protein R8510_04402 [Ralstonia chuxiongensis]|nr:hypothetical protein R8510_04402 [Ralstonia chuxiongensis]
MNPNHSDHLRGQMGERAYADEPNAARLFSRGLTA